MRTATSAALILACALAGWTLPAAQEHQPTPQPRQHNKGNEDPAEVARGRALFQSSCGFCHGQDATGSRAPDLLRSTVTLHDDDGNLLGPVIRNGRPDKGMPSFASLKDDQVRDIVAFLHHQADAARRSANVPGDYPVAKLLTGNKAEGEAFFNGPGGCTQCHSVTGDLAKVATRLSPIDLQQQMVYPQDSHVTKTATVTLPNGQSYHGRVTHDDEFNIAIVAQDGWHHSWPKKDVNIKLEDPLGAHRKLTGEYTDADIHNLFAYLETLK